jgi:hypothetical protein
MGTRGSCTRLALLGAGGLLLAACGDKEPCPGVVNGATYQIEVGTQAPVDPASECYRDWGFAEGSTFAARVTELMGDGSCLAGVPELEDLQDWSLMEHNTEASEGLLEGLYLGTFRSCSALLWLKVSEKDDMPCFSDGSAAGVQCLLTLPLQPQGAGCPAPCTAFFTTTVTRQ